MNTLLGEIGPRLEKASIITHPKIIHKRWGLEHTYYNNQYCLKTLFIRANEKGSMHFHVDKHETLYVAEGALLLKTKSKEGDTIIEHLVKKGEAVVIPPGFQHQLCALEKNLLIIESSTYDDSNDSVRVSL